ncbi:MAG: GAF domain-containing protein, partial [Anaerolineae bacterium]
MSNQRQELFPLQVVSNDDCAILNGLSDAILVIGLDRRIRLANAAARTLIAALNEPAGEATLAAKTCCELLGCRGNCDCPAETVLAKGGTVKTTQQRTTGHQAQPRYYDVIASPYRDAAGRTIGLIESWRDVTEERLLEETLVRRHEELAILHEIATTISQSLDLKEILGRSLDEVLRLTGIDSGAIFLREETLGKLELYAHRGFSEETARAVAQFGMLDGSCGGVLEHREVIVVPAVSRYRNRRARALQREKLSTLVHVPLVAKGTTLGSMCVATRREREFDAAARDLLYAIGSQIAVAIENARLYAELQRRERLRGELLHKIIAAQEEERKRIARDLHDETSQTLTALLYAVDEALELTDAAEIKQTLQNMRTIAQRTLDGVHKLIFDLRPSMLDHLGLAPALRWFAQSRLEPANVRLIIEDANAPRRLPAEVETALFRVFQEAITNIARHALARNVRIAFAQHNNMVEIAIEDDGIGFDMVSVTLSPDSGRGLGLLGMQERVELLGGRFHLDSAPGFGT